MNLYWHGGGSVSLESSDSYAFVDPASAEKEPKITEGVVLLAHNSSPKGLPKGIFVIDTAGEYNVKDFFITGLAGFSEGVSYLIEADDIKVCYLVKVKSELTDEQLASISDVDVLIISVGDSRAENEIASKVVNQIEPRIVIPVDFKEKPEEKYIVQVVTITGRHFQKNYREFSENELDKAE